MRQSILSEQDPFQKTSCRQEQVRKKGKWNFHALHFHDIILRRRVRCSRTFRHRSFPSTRRERRFKIRGSSFYPLVSRRIFADRRFPLVGFPFCGQRSGNTRAIRPTTLEFQLSRRLFAGKRLVFSPCITRFRRGTSIHRGFPQLGSLPLRLRIFPYFPRLLPPSPFTGFQRKRVPFR